MFILISLFISCRLTSGENINILEIFKRAYPDYFRIVEVKKDEFYDVIQGDSS
jgi:hypothetical protein